MLRLSDSGSGKIWVLRTLAVRCRSLGNLVKIPWYAFGMFAALQYMHRNVGVELPVTTPFVRCALNTCIGVCGWGSCCHGGQYSLLLDFLF